MTKRKPRLVRLKDWLGNGFKEAFEPALSGAWDGGAGTQQRKAKRVIPAEPIYLGSVELCMRCGCRIPEGHDHTDRRVCLQDFLAAVSHA